MTLVRRCRPQLALRAVATIVSAAAGNPLLLEQLPSDPPSPRLDRAIRMRLRSCAPGTRRGLALLALAGDAVPVDMVEPALDELLETGLAVSDGSVLRLRHALIAEAAAAALTRAERCQLHARLARAARTPGEAARHHHAAGELAEAHARALEAAETATTPGERARHLGVAAESIRSGGDAADRLRLRAASALLEAGEHADAARVAGSVEARDLETRATVLLHVATAAFADGRKDEAAARIEEGLALVGGTDSRIEALLCAERCELLLWEWDARGAVNRAREALALARRAGLDDPRFRSLLGRALYIAESVDSIAELLEAREQAERVGDARAECEAAAGLISAYHFFGDPESARAVARAMVDRAETLRLRGPALAFRFQVAFLDLAHRGAADDAIAELSLLLQEPGLGPLRDEVVAYLGLALAHLGRVDEAAAILAGAVEAARSEWGRALTLYVHSELAWADGRVDDGLAAVAACLSIPTPVIPWAEMMRGWLGEAPLSSGGERSPARIARGAVTAGRALQCLSDPARAGEAEQLFLEAAELFADVAVHEELRCLWAAGEAARQAGSPARAIVRLCAVERRAAAYAFLPLVNRVHQSLRRAGLRRAAPRARATGGLTAREQDVLALVAGGRTSPEIARALGLTVGTVDAEIRSAMTKLGAATRIQAALLATQSPPAAEAMQRPLVVARTREDVESASAELAAAGWQVRAGWSDPGDASGVVLAGSVASSEDAAAALLAATRGAGLVARVDAAPEVADAFLDDLQRIGEVDERDSNGIPPRPRLRPDQHRLLRLIAEGRSVAEAASELHLSRRTAERRLAAARAELGVDTTAEAAVAVAGRSAR